MRIGLFSLPFFRRSPAAPETYRDLCHELVRMGHEVTVLAEGRELPRGTTRLVMDGAIPVHLFRAHRLDLLRPVTWADRACKPFFRNSRFLSHLGFYLRFAEQHPELDLMDIDETFPQGAIAALVQRRIGRPFVVYAHGAGYGDSLGYPLAVRAMLRFAIRRADGIRAISPLMKRLLVEKLSADPQKISVVPSNLTRESVLPAGVPLADWRRDARETLFAQRVMRPAYLLVTMSRLVRMKGLEHAIAALLAIRRKCGDVALLVCGHGTVLKDLRAVAHREGVAEWVLLAGAVAHAQALRILAAADLHLAPSLIDALNMAVVEAGLVGTPSVATETSGISDWIRQYGAGAVVPAGSAHVLAEAASGLLSDPARLAQAGHNARAMAAAFQVPEIVRAVVRLYEGVLGNPAGGSGPKGVHHKASRVGRGKRWPRVA